MRAPSAIPVYVGYIYFDSEKNIIFSSENEEYEDTIIKIINNYSGNEKVKNPDYERDPDNENEWIQKSEYIYIGAVLYEMRTKFGVIMLAYSTKE